MVSMRVSRNGGGRCAGQARSVQLNSSLSASSEVAGAVSIGNKKGAGIARKRRQSQPTIVAR